MICVLGGPVKDHSMKVLLGYERGKSGELIAWITLRSRVTFSTDSEIDKNNHRNVKVIS